MPRMLQHPTSSILNRDDVDNLYKQVKEDVLADPGYLLQMITQMHKQEEYKKISEDI